MTEEVRPPQSIRNQSYVSFSSNRYSGHAYSNIVQTPVIGPRLTIVKSASETSVSLGMTITYRFTITNTGNREARAILYDPLPDGLVLVQGSVFVGGIPSPSSHPEAGIPIGRLDSGASVEVQFQANLQQLPASGQVKNKAKVTFTFDAPGQPPGSGRGRAESNTLVLPAESPRISVHKKASSPHSFPGDTLTYSITIVNEGHLPAKRLMLTDFLPEGTSLVPGSVRIGRSYAPKLHPEQGIELGRLAPGEAVEIAFAVMVLDSVTQTSLSNQASVRYAIGTLEADAASNTVTVQLWQPEIQLIKTVDAHEATVGDRLQYTIVVRNTGNVAAEIVLADEMPAGGLFVWGSAALNGRPLAAVHPADGITLDRLEPGTQATAVFDVTVTEAFLSGTHPSSLSNQAVARLQYQLPDGRIITDLVRSNRTYTDILLPLVDLTARAEPVVTEPCSVVTLHAAVTNRGNHPAKVTLQQLPPDETTLVPDSIRVGQRKSADPNPLDGLYLGQLKPGETVHVTCQVRVSCEPSSLELIGRLTAVYRYAVNDRTYERTVHSEQISILIGYQEE